MSDAPSDCPLAAVPLFPLPNVVLLPRAVLPLHIFEERYKAMVADVLGSDRLLAMALLRPGWEKCYYSRPTIEPIVCVGQILSWERLPDGRYNCLLQGKTRARILREYNSAGLSYRVAELAPVPETPVMEIDLTNERRRLLNILDSTRLAALPAADQFRALLRGPLPTPDLADLIAYNFLEDLQLKQHLLGEGDVRQRVETIVSALADFAAHINPALYGLPTDPGTN